MDISSVISLLQTLEKNPDVLQELSDLMSDLAQLYEKFKRSMNLLEDLNYYVAFQEKIKQEEKNKSV